MEGETVALDSMTGFDFEEFCAHLLAKLHYGEVERLVPAQGKGRDILVRTSTGLVVVGCRHDPRVTAGRGTVNRLRSSVISNRAFKGMLITTGHFTEDAVEYAQGTTPPVELVDWSKLAQMALQANIVVVSETEKLALWTFSLPSADVTRSGLGEYLDSILERHPRSASSMLRVERRMVEYRPAYFIAYDIDAVFATSIGVVHHEQASHATLILDGRNGQVLEKTITEFFANESQTHFLGPSEEFTGQLPALGLDITTVQNKVKGIISALHTRNVRYSARRNNRTYEKMCQPGERDIVVRDIRQTYLPFFRVHFKILETDYDCSLFQASSGRLFLQDNDIRLCRICNSLIESTVMVCDVCGRSTHTGGFSPRHVHGFRCSQCKRTTCRFDGCWIRRFLVLKALLCPECASQARERGQTVRKLNPI